MPSPKKRTGSGFCKANIAAMLEYTTSLNMWTLETLAKKMKLSVSTLISRKNKPYMWRMKDLKELSIYSGKSMDEMLNMFSDL